MSKDRKFGNESQDARRNDQHHASHPNENMKSHGGKGKKESRIDPLRKK